MIVRKANANDIDSVADIYDEIHTEIEKGVFSTGWIRGIYPLKSTAQNAFEKDWLFVAEEEGKIVAAAIINQYQGPIYEEAAWEFEATENEVMVLHTLVVSPSCSKNVSVQKWLHFTSSMLCRTTAENCAWIPMQKTQ